MALDPKYVPLTSLGAYFVEKLTALPLKNGIVTFYSDVNRSTLKPVYEISGSPPNYSYTQLPNPLTLSGTGTFIDDDNNQIIPYGYPYDDQGAAENYYIVITSEGGDQEWTVEAWPNITDGSSPESAGDLFNYISNGQFWAHNDLPEDILNNIPFGQIREPITEIAPDSFTFERPEGSTATDNVQFFKYGEYVDDPTASPRYACRIQCLGADIGDAYKYLRKKFINVNQFASDTQQYTFSFSAKTYNSSNFTIGLYLIKDYGTGGSPAPVETTQLTTFTITASEQIFQFSFVFGTNEGKQVGDDFESDSVSLALGLPTNISSGMDITNLMLNFGQLQITQFPEITYEDTVGRSMATYNAQYDGSSLFFPVVNNKNGLVYDSDGVGDVGSTIKNDFVNSLSTKSNKMLLDGNQYLVSGYSPLGIPFSRLFYEVFFDQTTYQSSYGSGKNFVTCYTQGGVGSSANLFLFNNYYGAVAPPANGSISAGITFFNITNGSSPGGGLNVYIESNSSITWIGQYPGNVATLDLDSTGFTFTPIKNSFSNQPFSTNQYPQKWIGNLNLNSVLPSSLASKYLRWGAINASSTEYQSYTWWTVDGAGTDPGLGGTPIKVNLKSTFSQDDFRAIQCFSMLTTQSTYLTFPDVSSITAGSYWTFQTADSKTYVIYNVIDGAGNPPPIAATLKIPVNLLSTDSSIQYAQKTMIAINSTYYCVPDFRGLFIRGFDPNENWDLDATNRLPYLNIPGMQGNNISTFEYDTFSQHTHQIVQYNTGGANTHSEISTVTSSGFSNPFIPTTQFIYYEGQYETRPSNALVNWYIKY